MPELPEVTVTSNYLNNLIKNLKIKKIDIFYPKMFKENSDVFYKKNIENETILEVKNLGKFIIFYLSNEKILLSHMRMEGKYFFKDKNQILANPAFPSHSRVVFHFENGDKLFYRDSRMFGTFHLKNEKNFLKTKPLNLLAKTPFEIDIKKFFEITKKSKKKIKNLLLDQSKICGLGNIYVDETLHKSKILPWTKADKISYLQIKNIVKNASKILQKATELGGSSVNSYKSINQQEGNFQNFLMVYQKQNTLCKTCKISLIKKTKINGRGTHYCLTCQK